jgi:hypothetical protein
MNEIGSMKTRGGRMATERVVILGIIKDGLVVPQGPVPLPEGTQVGIIISGPELEPEWRAEYDAWEQAGDEAWAQIDEWEREEGS